ncbi:MAG: ATP-binding protein [Kiritimatiellae bacterium]|nr:ATP-binding protein [Kiritimatiellia bacterium]
MKAVEKSVRQILSGDVVLVTPSFQHPFQRPDADTRVRMLNALRLPPGSPVFLGGLVTRPLSGPGALPRKELLVDGNQRMLAILAVLLALRDAVAPFDATLAAQLDRAFFRPSGRAPAAFPYKNLTHARDRAVFAAAVRGAPSPAAAPHPFGEALAAAKAEFAPLPGDTLAELARRLPDTATFVVMALAADEDPYPVYKLFNPGAGGGTGPATYGAFAQDPELMDLIAGGESQEVEFKAHFIVTRPGEERGRQAQGVARAVASLLNSDAGGTLLVGVADDGAVCGIEGEYAAADRGKRDWDGWQLHLANHLRTRLGSTEALLHCGIERRTTLGHDVCLLRVRPSPRPVFLDGRLFVRTSAQTLPVPEAEQAAFRARRFPNLAGEHGA